MAIKNRKARRTGSAPEGIEKAPTGIRGLDEVTRGGLPRGRPTLVCGNAGCGKTILGMEFLLHGAEQFGEPGVFVSFEERSEELAQNCASLGFDLPGLIRRGRIAVDHVHIERSEIEETGDYDLDGLFIRLAHAIDSIGAKRVVLDTIEALFGGFSNDALLRAELRRLFRWLKDRGITAIITGERGNQQQLTRHGLEEYVADCVILLDLRVQEQIATRRLRIVKYRGTTHGGDEYPFLIDEGGISILPITSLGLDHPVSRQRISSGVERLDTMLGGKGYYRGTAVLVSGNAGSGKTSLAATFVEAACRRGERCLYFAFEESPAQIVRNMGSIGCDLEPWIAKGLLRFQASRPSLCGLEMHLVAIHKQIQQFDPAVVVIDPISNLTAAGSGSEAKSMLTRLIDLLKMRQITALMTDLTHGDALETSSAEVSSLVDSWLCLRDLEFQGERNRGLHILKSRGMAHSNQVREFVLSGRGIELRDVYAGSGGVLTGTARSNQEAQEKAEAVASAQALERRQRAYERKRQALEASIAALRLEFDSETEDLRVAVAEETARLDAASTARARIAASRGADPAARPLPPAGRRPGKRR